MSTRRQRIAAYLEEAQYFVGVNEICEVLDIRNKRMVYEDLEHISKSVKNQGKELVVKPAICGKCNFVFKGRKSMKSPSRCPKCRSNWILSPEFLIRPKK